VQAKKRISSRNSSRATNSKNREAGGARSGLLDPAGLEMVKIILTLSCDEHCEYLGKLIINVLECKHSQKQSNLTRKKKDVTVLIC